MSPTPPPFLLHRQLSSHSLQSPFNPYQAENEQILHQVQQGDLTHLPELLQRLEQAAYRQQIPASLATLQALCRSLVDADVIWISRNRLLLNNIARYQTLSFSATEYCISENAAPWYWEAPAEEYLHCILADIDIWRYCQNSHRAPGNIRFALYGESNRPAVFNALVFCAYTNQPNAVEYALAVDLLHQYSQSFLHKAALRQQLNHRINIERLLLALHNADRGSYRCRHLVIALVNLLPQTELLALLPELLPFAPDAVIATLEEAANGPACWFRGYFSGSPLRQQQQEQNLTEARQQLQQQANLARQAIAQQHSEQAAKQQRCAAAMRHKMTHLGDIMNSSTGAQ